MEITAKITDTELRRDDKGIMTFTIFINFWNGYSCFGSICGFPLDEYDKKIEIKDYNSQTMEAISKVLETVGVNFWEDLKGQYIRIKNNGWGTIFDEIGNYTEEKWFNLREFFGQAE